MMKLPEASNPAMRSTSARTTKKDVFHDGDKRRSLSGKLIKKLSFLFNRNLYWDYAVRKYRYPIDVVYETVAGSDARFKLAVVAIMKNEDDYLEEWLEFHKIQGIEHFYLYDNGCSQATRHQLDRFIRDGVVTYAPFPHLPNTRTDDKIGAVLPNDQNLAYGECICRFGDRIDWLIQLDLDEFVFPTIASGFERLSEVVDYLEAGGYCGLRVRMHDFGSSWHRNRPAGLVIENFTRRAELPRWSVKCLARMSHVKRLRYSHPHQIYYKGVSFLPGAAKVLGEDKTALLLRLNHYRTKSLEECLNKTDTNFLSGKYNEEKFSQSEKFLNEVQDEGEILRYRDRVAAAVKFSAAAIVHR